MNKIALALISALLLVLAGCGKAKSPAPPENPPVEQPAPPPVDNPAPSPAAPVHKSDYFEITTPIPAKVGRQLTLSGRARVEGGRFVIVVEDGHNELVRQEVAPGKSAPEWGDFTVTLDLAPPTSPSGMIYFVVKQPDGTQMEDLMIPVSFAIGQGQ